MVVQVIGSCHPPGENENYAGFLLKKSDFKQKCKELIGLYVLEEHEQEKPVGIVRDACIKDGTGQLMVKLDIFNE